MSYIVAVPARLKSTRISDKLLIKINNYECILHTLLQISVCVPKEKIYVFTDSIEIQNVVIESGFNSLIVDSECVNGTERISKGLSILEKTFDHVLLIHGDQPLLNPSNIYTLIKFWESSRYKSDTNTMHTLHSKCEPNNTSIAKIAMTNGGKWLYISRQDIPSGYEKHDNILYKHIGICMFHKSMLLNYKNLTDTPLQINEDNEWLKLLENDYNIFSTEVEFQDRDLNTFDDLNYIKTKLLKEGS